MERLTFEGNFCDISKCGYLICPHDGNCSQKQVWERLKQFEDVFGTPEKAERVKLAFMGKAVYEIKEFDGVPIKRLIELAEADKDGRVVVLPCKAGDMLYEVTNRKTISEYCVTAICVTLGGIFIEWEIRKGFAGRSASGIVPTAIGKTVFLTREEAEKALQEMKGDTEK